MISLPKNLQRIIDFFQTLPGIGPKTARRLGFYLLRLPKNQLQELAEDLKQLKDNSHYCQICFNLTENERCSICQDQNRDQTTITVVEEILDLLSIENTQKYQGVYHVLHGRIDPLNYIQPEDIFIEPLLKRVSSETKEIILATNPNLEGEATAMYIKKKLEEIKNKKNLRFKITRLAYGLPLGADIEYADLLTIQKAIEGRKDY